MFFSFLIIIISYIIYKFSVFSTNRIQYELQEYFVSECMNQGLVSRSFFAKLSNDSFSKFCKFFLLSKGYRNITSVSEKIENGHIYSAIKNNHLVYIYISDIAENISPLDEDTLQELFGIIISNQITRFLYLGDLSVDLLSKVNKYTDISCDTHSFLELCDFYWDKSISFKEGEAC